MKNGCIVIGPVCCFVFLVESVEQVQMRVALCDFSAPPAREETRTRPRNLHC